MNAAIKQWAKKIRQGASKHPQWKALIAGLTIEFNSETGRHFTEKEMARAVNDLFNTYDPNALAPPELFMDDEWNEPKLPNPFWSLTTIDEHGNVLDVFVSDSDDLDRLSDFLLRDPTKELQDDYLNNLWKSIKQQQPDQQNLPYFIYFAFLVNDEKVERQARKKLKQHPQHKEIEEYFRKSISTQYFLEMLYRKLQINIEIIIELLIHSSKLTAMKTTWMDFCKKLKIPFDRVPSIFSFNILLLDWSEVEADNYFEDLKQFTQLKKLNLYCYTRHEFPDMRCVFQGVEKISIRGRVKITAAIGLLHALTEFTLNDLKLEQLPSELFTLPNLNILRLNKNRLTNLPAISPDNALRKLELAFNRIEALPDTFSNLTQLEELNLSHNGLKNLAHIDKLTQLRHLDMSNNQLTAIAPEIGRLKNLQEIDFAGNNMVDIPEEIVSLKNLKNLNMQFNPVDESRFQWLRKNMPQTQIIH